MFQDDKTEILQEMALGNDWAWGNIHFFLVGTGIHIGRGCKYSRVYVRTPVPEEVWIGWYVLALTRWDLCVAGLGD